MLLAGGRKIADSVCRADVDSHILFIAYFMIVSKLFWVFITHFIMYVQIRAWGHCSLFRYWDPVDNSRICRQCCLRLWRLISKQKKKEKRLRSFKLNDKSSFCSLFHYVLPRILDVCDQWTQLLTALPSITNLNPSDDGNILNPHHRSIGI